MVFSVLKEKFSKSYGIYVIILFIPISVIMDFSQHRWMDPESVISYDIKGYYGYLPALLIHHDVKLNYIKENPREHGKWIWPVKTPTGENCILYTMGLAFLYLPFFLIAHLICLLGPYEATGYTMPYALLLQMSAIVYSVIGMFYLRKLLRLFFSEFISLITVLLVFAGTNLLMYTTFLAPYSHAYSFCLIVMFLYFSLLWGEKPNIKYSVIAGVLLGLISLIRPNNAIIVFFLLLNRYNIFKDSIQVLEKFLRDWKYILLIGIVSFIFILPQLIYWKHVSGKFLFNTYASTGQYFFWDRPQIMQLLFSFRKSWFLYTPLMLFVIPGLFYLRKELSKFIAPVLIILTVSIYVNSSWWCWWFGGGLGIRPMIDFYGLFAIPLAAILDKTFRKKNTLIVTSIISLLLIFNNIKVTYQYNHNTLHWEWNSKDGYLKSFFKLNPTNRIKELALYPDYENGLKGIYVSKNIIERDVVKKDSTLRSEQVLFQIKDDIFNNERLMKKCAKKAEKYNYPVDSIVTIEARNIFERKNIKPYIDNLIKE